MPEREMVTVFGLDAWPGEDWMFECDGCGLRVRSDEALRDCGEMGKKYARDIMALSGWTFEAPNRDLCPTCAGTDVEVGSP